MNLWITDISLEWAQDLNSKWNDLQDSWILIQWVHDLQGNLSNKLKTKNFQAFSLYSREFYEGLIEKWFEQFEKFRICMSLFSRFVTFCCRSSQNNHSKNLKIRILKDINFKLSGFNFLNSLTTKEPFEQFQNLKFEWVDSETWLFVWLHWICSKNIERIQKILSLLRSSTILG